MKFFRKLAAAASMVGLLAGAPVSAQQQPKQIRQLLAMTPADHARLVKIVDHDLETVAKFDTHASFQFKQGLLGVVWNDIFLRAFVDKTTGKLSIQTYFRFRGEASTWPRFEVANFRTPEGIQSADLDRIFSDVSCSGVSRYGGNCAYLEEAVFNIDEQLARNIAATYAVGAGMPWAIRFKGQSGLNVDMEILPAEMAGLLKRVDDYRTTLGLEIDEVEADGDLLPTAPMWSEPGREE